MIARLLMPKMYFLDNVVDKVCGMMEVEGEK